MRCPAAYGIAFLRHAAYSSYRFIIVRARRENIARLYSVKVPIRCWSDEERQGVERWQAEARDLVPRAEKLLAASLEVSHAHDEHDQLRSESLQYQQFDLAGLAMELVQARVSQPHATIARTVWEVVIVTAVELRRDGTLSIAEFPAPDYAAIAHEMRPRLAAWKDRCLTSPKFEPRRAAIAALESFSDRELATLHNVPPFDLLADFLDCPREADATAVFIDAAARARARAKSAELAAEAERALQLGKKLADILVRDAEAFATEVRRARSVLPGSGETADLEEMISPVDRGLLEEPEPGPILDRPNRVATRMALWFALAGVRGCAETRRVLRQLVEHPRTFARFDPKSAAGLEAKRQLRPLQKLLTGPRREHEYHSLCAAIDSPATSDAELRWMLSEYILSGLAAGIAPGDLGEVGEMFCAAIAALLDDDGAAGYLKLCSAVSVYDGKVVLKTAVDAAIAALEAGEIARAAATAEATPGAEVGYTPFRPMPTPAAVAAKPLQVCYVLNPERPQPHRVSVRCTEADAYRVVLDLLDEHARTPEPNPSLARAVYHYAFRLAEEHRQTWNKERVGPFVFHKLKRGAARIWVRREEDTILLHAFSRRDWRFAGD